MLAILLALALPIAVQHLGDDPIAIAYADAVRQSLQGQDLTVVDDPKAAQVIVLIISTPVTVGTAYRATAISTAVLWNVQPMPLYLSGSVKVIPRAWVVQRAQEASAEIRSAVTVARKRLSP